MTVDQIVKVFGSTNAASKAMNITPAAISMWRIRGVPKLRKFQIEKLTNGKLKAQ